MFGVLLAVAASAMNATASVLQRRATKDQPDKHAFSVRLLLDVLKNPAWLAGIGAILAGFLLQAAALTVGRISVVQPLLVSELPFTLLLASAVFRFRLGRQEWAAIACLTVGLPLFVVALSPSPGDPLAAPLWEWLVGVGASLAVAATFVVLGYRSSRRRRAAWLGIATGVGFGLTAALVAAVGASFQHGIAGVFTAWQTYAVLILGPASFFLLQTTFQSGELVASQPGLTLTNPLVSLAWGLAVFNEQARGGPWIAGALFGTALIAGGTVLLARSPLLQGPQEQHGQPAGRHGRGHAAQRSS